MNDTLHLRQIERQINLFREDGDDNRLTAALASLDLARSCNHRKWSASEIGDDGIYCVGCGIEWRAHIRATSDLKALIDQHFPHYSEWDKWDGVNDEIACECGWTDKG